MLKILYPAILSIALAYPALAEDAHKICYRDDAAPFSHVDTGGTPTGYSVNLCRRVLAEIGTPDPEMILVSAEDRFTTLTSGKCHVLCEATTVSMKRRESMEFSLITFLTGAAFLYPNALVDGGAATKSEMVVGFLSGTTAHEKWKSGDLVSGTAFDFAFAAVESHEDATTQLLDGTLQAYVADREILERILSEQPQLAKAFRVGRKSLSYEPYALAVDMGNDTLRVKIDAVLAQLFRSGEITEILGEHVPQRRFDPILLDLFELQSLPE